MLPRPRNPRQLWLGALYAVGAVINGAFGSGSLATLFAILAAFGVVLAYATDPRRSEGTGGWPSKNPEDYR